MSNTRDPRTSKALPALFFGGLALYTIHWMGWTVLTYHGEIKPLAVVAYLVLLACTMSLLSDWLWYLGNSYDLQATLTPEGNKGTAEFVRDRQEIAHELIETGWGPYWGSFQGEEIISDFGSVALTCGTAGSGKGIGKIQPNILSIRESKVVIDLKSDLVCVLAKALRARGETVHILNFGDVNEHILGESSSYNPLCLIADDFWRPGGVQDISDDVFEFCLQLSPEPSSAGPNGSENTYFRDGSRGFLGLAILISILVRGHRATFGDVVELLSDRRAFLHHAQWVCGRLEQVSQEEAAQ